MIELVDWGWGPDGAVHSSYDSIAHPSYTPTSMSVPTASPTPARYRVRDDGGGGAAAESDGVDTVAVVGGSIVAGAACYIALALCSAGLDTCSQLSTPCVCGCWDKIE